MPPFSRGPLVVLAVPLCHSPPMHTVRARRSAVLEELGLFWRHVAACGIALPAELHDTRGFTALHDALGGATGGSGTSPPVPLGARERVRRTERLLRCLRALRPLDTVNLHVTLDASVSDDGLDVISGVEDPRFAAGTSAADRARKGTDDLRYAAIRWRARVHGLPDEVDPQAFSALLALEEGRLDSPDAWFDLSHEAWPHELEERAEGLYDLGHISADSVEVHDVMAHMWDAAETERRRRWPLASRCPRCEATSTTLFSCAACEIETLRDLCTWGRREDTATPPRR